MGLRKKHETTLARILFVTRNSARDNITDSKELAVAFETVDHIAVLVASFLQLENPRLNATKFLDRCGYKYGIEEVDAPVIELGEATRNVQHLLTPHVPVAPREIGRFEVEVGDRIEFGMDGPVKTITKIVIEPLSDPLLPASERTVRVFFEGDGGWWDIPSGFEVKLHSKGAKVADGRQEGQ
jgi:hypothetical protein